MEKLDLLYEGKAKKVYATNEPDVLIVDYKDEMCIRDSVNIIETALFDGQGVLPDGGGTALGRDKDAAAPGGGGCKGILHLHRIQDLVIPAVQHVGRKHKADGKRIPVFIEIYISVLVLKSI